VLVAAAGGRGLRPAARASDGDAGAVAACAGLGITLLATSLASFAYRVSFPKVNSPPTITDVRSDGGLPIPVLNAQTPLTLLALLLVPAIAWVLYRTPAGLALRMVGENPQAAEGQGLSSPPRAPAPSSPARR
jgi:ABC-type uncharacterized transport system permease subunit